jgi:hypothetical protein
VGCQVNEPSVPDTGLFLTFHRPEALCFGAFWRRGLARAKAEGRLTGGAAHLDMEAKALLAGTAPRGRRRCRKGLEAQHLLACPPKRNAVGAGCLLQGPSAVSGPGSAR